MFRTSRAFPFIFRTKRSFPFIFWVFGDLWNPKEQWDRSLHLKWTEMNVSFIFRTFGSIFEFLATYETTFDPQKGQKKLENRTKRSKNERNVLFTVKKWTQRMKHSFAKNRNERRERNVLLQRTEMNVENETLFWKERMPNPGVCPLKGWSLV